jgi:predicted RNA binding protein YcfA (HicA-like mRNA interferase family)
VKRGDLFRHLRANGCSLEREGSKHTIYVNVVGNMRSTIPRHSEIRDFMVRKICRDIGIAYPGEADR